MLDGLRVGCGLRSYYNLPHFVVWDVIPVFNSQYFLFQFSTCIDRMFDSAICTYTDCYNCYCHGQDVVEHICHIH